MGMRTLIPTADSRGSFERKIVFEWILQNFMSISEANTVLRSAVLHCIRDMNLKAFFLHCLQKHSTIIQFLDGEKVLEKLMSSDKWKWSDVFCIGTLILQIQWHRTELA